MVPANKILTVAYGTFSCTLEGFDDPFSTMTGIAEYFRDLAAEDRFFGAEPPTPDMAMLRMIAETRAKHAVTALPEDGGITLRPTAAPTPAAMAAAFEAAPARESVPTGLAATLAAGLAETDLPAAGASGEWASDSRDNPDDKVADLEKVEEPTPAVETLSEDTAAKLARIRQLVDADRGMADDYDEDEYADEIVAVRSHAEATVDAKKPQDSQASEPISSVDCTEPLTLGPDVMPKSEDHGESSRPDPVLGEPRRFRVRRVRRGRAETAAPSEATAPDEQSADEAAATSIMPTGAGSETSPTDEPITNITASDEAGETDHDLLANLAAIEAEWTRDAFEGATTDFVADQQDAESDAARSQGEALVTEELHEALGLTPDNVAEAEGNVVQDTDVAASEEPTPEPDDAGGNHPETKSTEIGAKGEAETPRPEKDLSAARDMERLFAATDSRLSGEETLRRHANISHVKAAVAARRADRPAKVEDRTETSAYRADLANVVRPRRNPPSADAPALTPRPERAAPLMLVSKQRVETISKQAAGPVSPRRPGIMVPMDTLKETLDEAEDFEAFAAEIGARDLADVLEAAAVYSVRVMGEETFTRPRLLHLAAEAVDDMSREAGLRGFGQLLRNGTFRKVSLGVFTLAKESRFAEEADRRAS